MRFNLIKMEDALESLIDYRGKTPKKSETGIMTLSAKSVKNNHIDYSQCYFISEEEYKRFMVRGIPKKGDILLTTEAPLGCVARLDRDDVAIAQRLLTLRGKKEVLDNDYLLYYLQSPIGQASLKARESGTTVTGIKQSEFKKIELMIPDYEAQRYISSILRTIDKKIELNNAINNNLEKQARSLFKSWFISYDPFQNTMPSNWKTGKLKELLQLKRQSIKPGSNTELPYLPIDIIPMNSFAITDFKANEDAKSSLIKFDKDDIVIGAMRVYFHRIILAPCDGITRTTCFTLAPYQKEYLSFAFLCCDQDSSIDYAQRTSKGSTMPYAVWEGGLGEMEINIPSPQIAEEFNMLVLPLLRKIQYSYFENKYLKELRDSLLPRLISGKIDISNINI